MSAHWRPVLVAFATSLEPITWALPGLKITRVEKYEALMYLLEKGLLVAAGRQRKEWNDMIYAATAEGRLVYGAVKGSIGTGAGRVDHAPTTVAQRAVASGPVDVFDLVRKPWLWDKASEQRADWVEEMS